MMSIKKKACILIFLSFFGGFSCLEAASSSQSANTPQPDSKPLPSAKAKKKKEKKETGPLVDLGFLNVPVIRGSRPVAYVGLQVILEGNDPKATEILRNNKAQIYSALFMDFYSLSDILWGIEDAINLMSLKKRFEKICIQLLGVNLVEHILLQKSYVKELK